MGANSVYSATQAALRSFARTWTVDLKDRHIRVNVVSPGFTDTPGLRQLLAARGAEQSLKGASDIIPLGTTGTPDDNRQGCCVPCLRRQQLHHGNGIVCGLRLRASVELIDPRTVIHNPRRKVVREPRAYDLSGPRDPPLTGASRSHCESVVQQLRNQFRY